MSKQLAKRGGGRSDSTSLPAFCPSYCLFRSFPQKNIIIIIIIIIILLFRLPVECPAGTYYNRDSQTCQNCQEGTFQSRTGQLSCDACPAGTWTVGGHAKKLADCFGKFLFTPDQFDFRYCKLVKIPKQKGILTRTLKLIQNRPYYLIRNLV